MKSEGVSIAVRNKQHFPTSCVNLKRVEGTGWDTAAALLLDCGLLNAVVCCQALSNQGHAKLVFVTLNLHSADHG